MAAEHDRPAFVTQRQDQRAHVAAPNGVEAGHGLVEHHEVWILDERLGHAQPLNHPLRVAPECHATLGAEPDAIQEHRGTSPGGRGAHSAELTVVGEQFLSAEIVVEDGVLRQEPDATARRDVRDGKTEEMRAARGRRHKPHQQLERGALAGAVGAEAPEDLPGRHTEGERVECAIGARTPETDRVVLGEAIDGEDRFGHVVRAACRRTSRRHPLYRQPPALTSRRVRPTC